MGCESNTEIENEANTRTGSCSVAFRGRHVGQRQRRPWPALSRQRRVGVARRPMNATANRPSGSTSLIAGEIGALTIESLVELLHPLSRISELFSCSKSRPLPSRSTARPRSYSRRNGIARRMKFVEAGRSTIGISCRRKADLDLTTRL